MRDVQATQFLYRCQRPHFAQWLVQNICEEKMNWSAEQMTEHQSGVIEKRDKEIAALKAERDKL